MNNYKLIISYDGTLYSGWQFQPNVPTVQGTIEKALEKICINQKIQLIGSGRTDAGVHALNQTANIFLKTDISVNNLKKAINSYLPNDIFIRSCSLEEDDFHARFSAKKRKYIYYISKEYYPHNRFFSWKINWDCDKSILFKCSDMVKGKHDFSCFSKLSSEVKNKICMVYDSCWTIDKSGYKYKIVADRFLHHMVRFIVGTMIEVSRGRYSIDDFENMINTINTKKTALCAPPKGLFLDKVYYD